MIIGIHVYHRDEFVIYVMNNKIYYHEYGSEQPDKELIEVDQIPLSMLSDGRTVEDLFDMTYSEYDIVGLSIDKKKYRFYRFKYKKRGIELEA